MATEQRATLKPVQEWFTFEGRCMVCGTKIGRPNQDDNGLRGAHYLHLDAHCRDGHMRRDGMSYAQVKARHIGFPGSAALEYFCQFRGDGKVKVAKDVIRRLKGKGLLLFPKPPKPKTEDHVRAYHTERQRKRLGYKPWEPGSPGRPPFGLCRWCGGKVGRKARCPCRW